MIDTLMPTPPQTRPVRGWASLLGFFYAQAGRPLIPLERLSGELVPQPYHDLLVHNRDMTPTLEKHYDERLRLRLICREQQEDAYLREVALELAESHRPVEYGAIRVFLQQFPENARRMILEERRPLGAILQSEAIAHVGWPQAFFRAQSDSRMESILRLPSPRTLYGRRNLLLNGERQVLAEVIEVLAPAENDHPTQKHP